MRKLIIILIAILSLPGFAEANEIALTSQVFGLDNYTERTSNEYPPGAPLELYIETRDVSHRGFTAVDFVIAVYDNTEMPYKLLDLEEYTFRYKNNTQDISFVYRFDIPEELREGRYSMDVTAYDRVYEEGLNLIYVSTKETAFPDISTAKEFMGAPTGINVDDNDYTSSNVLRPRGYITLLYTKRIEFTVSRKAEVSLPKTINAKAALISQVFGLDNYTERTSNEYPPGAPLELYIETRDVSHRGFTAVDFVIAVYDNTEMPYKLLDLEEYTFRYKNNTQDISFVYRFDIPEELREGRYSIDILAYNKVNEDELNKIYNPLGKRLYPDTSLAKKFIKAPTGINVKDEEYEDLNLLLGRNVSLGFRKTFSFVISEAPAISEITGAEYPVMTFKSLNIPKYQVAPGESFRVSLKASNIGDSGDVQITLEIRGKENGYKLPKTLQFSKGETKTVTFDVSLPLEEGVWKIGVLNSDLMKPIFVYEEKVEEVTFIETLKPKEVYKSPYVIAFLLILIIPLASLRIFIKQSNTKVAQSVLIGIDATFLILVFLLIVYLIYYFYAG